MTKETEVLLHRLPNGAVIADLPDVDLNRWYRVPVAAAYWDVSPWTVYKKIEAGEVDCIPSPYRIRGDVIAAGGKLPT